MSEGPITAEMVRSMLNKHHEMRRMKAYWGVDSVEEVIAAHLNRLLAEQEAQDEAALREPLPPKRVLTGTTTERGAPRPRRLGFTDWLTKHGAFGVYHRSPDCPRCQCIVAYLDERAQEVG